MQALARLGLATLGILLTLCPAFAAAPVLQRSDALGLTLGDTVDYHVVAAGTVTDFAAQGLPNGVTIDASTGWIHGTPSDVGSYRAVVTASNLDGSSSMTLALAVVSPDAAPLIYAPLQFDAYATTAQGGNMFTCSLKATGRPTSFQSSDALPTGWSFADGTIVGTTTSPGQYLVPVSATNTYGIGSAAVTVRVHPSCIQMQQTTGALKAGDVFTVTLRFSQPVTFSGEAPYLEFHTYPDSGTHEVTYLSGNGTDTFVFGYTVTARDAPGDILLYNAIQPSLGSGVNGLNNADGLTVGAALPISGAYSPTATIVASPSVSSGTVASAKSTTTARATNSTPTGSAGTTTTASSDSTATTTTAANPGAGATTATSSAVSAAEAGTSRLVNLSARGLVSDGNSGRAFIAGFVVSGNAPKRMLLRAVGPTLGAFNVQAPLPNPQLRVYDAGGHVIAENDDWSGADVAATAASVGAFDLPSGSRDAALTVTLPPGNYSMQVLPNGASGVALAEIYDADSAGSTPLVNISTRGYVTPGEGVLTAGFYVAGTVPKRLLIRGVGPALADFAVADVLANPSVTIYQGNSIVAKNDDWGSGQTKVTSDDVAAAAKAAGAFSLKSGSRDAATIVTLAPGLYTAAVTGANGTSGAAMVEVYELK